MQLLLVQLLITSSVLSIYADGQYSCREANLTNWREHRRQKRFIIFTDAGVCKLTTGVSIPVDRSIKKPWVQLVMLVNLQYQFSVPITPIYWWNVWKDRALVGNSDTPINSKGKYVDSAQILIYKFVVEFMNQKGLHGGACLKLAICENAQIDKHAGVYAEILHRLLIPHPSVDEVYVDAFRMGRHGVDCRTKFTNAQNCLLDKYTHVREELLTGNVMQSFKI
ncbi:uncharacterized protein LOC119680120 [Teleopsis dalmanni]|uniref:uncharacterized protein LOC119680120 n=1 Tax=Teleopsis dalmanni TaxID=139649 RepID=UPI0018CDD051|nr:uncharacterized protein LOC119680120 [Teleopsis dalmanni]